MKHYIIIAYQSNNKVLIYAISMSAIEYDRSVGQKKFMSMSSQISWWEETRWNRDQLFQITSSAQEDPVWMASAHRASPPFRRLNSLLEAELVLRKSASGIMRDLVGIK